jgi:3'-5' exonuclease
MQNFFFIDFETVPVFDPKAMSLPEPLNTIYTKRFGHKIDEGTNVLDHFKSHAGLYAEHCKIVSVSIGVLIGTKFYVKTFASKDEKAILTNLKKALEDGTVVAKTLAGHNIKEFDCPVGMRRYIVNKMSIPRILNVAGLKPWELPYKDTMEIWGGTQWKYMTSVDLLCYTLGIDSPKTEISGGDICSLYYSMFDVPSTDLPFDKEAEVLGQIARYNASDMIASARLYARIMGHDEIKDDQIHHLPVE